MIPLTRASVLSPPTADEIASWNVDEVASDPGAVDRKTAMTELLPAPNWLSSRFVTSADSEELPSQPPELRAEDVCVARAAPPSATRTFRMAIGRRNR